MQKNFTATIPNGAALSNALALAEFTLAGLLMPAAWTAADLTFQVSIDGGAHWYDLHDDGGNEMKISTPAAGEYRQLDPSGFSSVGYLRVRSGVSSSAVNQGQESAITLIGHRFFSMR